MFSTSNALKKSFLTLLCVTSLLNATTVTYRFTHSRNTRSTPIYWTLTSGKDEIRISGEDAGGTISILATPDYRELYYACHGARNYTIKREKDLLHIEGTTEKGAFIQHTRRLKNEPWVQQIAFGLRSFLKSENRSYPFTIINPKTLEPVRMRAIKERATSSTQPITLTLQGWRKMFWSAHAWYDKATYDLLKYEGNEGPNTPTTTIVFEQRQIKEETSQARIPYKEPEAKYGDGDRKDLKKTAPANQAQD